MHYRLQVPVFFSYYLMLIVGSEKLKFFLCSCFTSIFKHPCLPLPGGGVGACCWHLGWNNPLLGFPGGLVIKNPPANAGEGGDKGSIPGSGRFPWRRGWQPTLVFLPGKSHRQRSLAGCSPWGHKESDTTERLSISTMYFGMHV